METHAAREPGVVAPTTMREDLITIGLATWMIFGLMVDAYFHSTDADLETFLTPWNGLFYSGFISMALWLNRITFARRRPTGNILTWAPPGDLGWRHILCCLDRSCATPSAQRWRTSWNGGRSAEIVGRNVYGADVSDSYVKINVSIIIARNTTER